MIWNKHEVDKWEILVESKDRVTGNVDIYLALQKTTTTTTTTNRKTNKQKWTSIFQHKTLKSSGESDKV